MNTKIIYRLLLLEFLLLVASFSTYSQDSTQSNFWSLFKEDFRDNSVVNEYTKDLIKVDSIGYSITDKILTYKLNYDSTLNIIEKIGSSTSDTSWYKSVIERYISLLDTLNKTPLVKKYKSSITYHNILIDKAYQSANKELFALAIEKGNRELMMYKTAYQTNENVEKIIEGEGAWESPNQISPSTCRYKISINKKYFDDPNLSLYIINTHYFGKIRNFFKQLQTLEYGPIPYNDSDTIYSKNLKLYLQKLAATDNRLWCCYISNDNFFKEISNYKMCETSSLDPDTANKWFVFVFYRRCLMYINQLSPCSNSVEQFIK